MLILYTKMMTFAKSGGTYSRTVHRASCELLTLDNTFWIVVHSNEEYVRCPFLTPPPPPQKKQQNKPERNKLVSRTLPKVFFCSEFVGIRKFSNSTFPKNVQEKMYSY